MHMTERVAGSPAVGARRMAWRAWTVVAAVPLIFLIDYLVPSLDAPPLVIVPLVLAALFMSSRSVAALALLSVGLAVLSGLASGSRWDGNAGLWIGSLLAAGVAAMVVARKREQLETAQAQAIRQLRESERRNALLATTATDVVSEATVDGIVIWVSDSVERLLGVPASSLTGKSVIPFMHPSEVDVFKATVPKLATGEPATYMVRLRGADGSYRRVEFRSRARIDADGRVISRVAGWRDVELERSATEALRLSEARFRLLAEHSSDLVFACAPDMTVIWVSPSVSQVFGYQASEVIGNNVSALLDPLDAAVLRELGARFLAATTSTVRARLLAKDAASRWMELTSRAVLSDAGEVTARVISMRDVDGEVRSTDALEYAIDFDALTGVAKQPLALRRLSALLRQHTEPGWPLLCAGVRGLTAINDAYTHAAGDAVLRHVAERLTAMAGGAGAVARVAGAEFLVFLPLDADKRAAARAAQRFIDEIEGPLQYGDASLHVSIAIGIALSGADALADELLRDATAAMRQVRALSTGRWEFLDGDVGAATRERLALHAELRTAIERHRLVPWLMPLMNLATGALAGYEALVRWNREDGSVSSPDVFLDAAAQLGLTYAIDTSMLSDVLQWLAAHPDAPTVAVNVSATTLLHGNYPEFVRVELQRFGVAPNRLQLEITESALIDTGAVLTGAMSEIAEFGVVWWVDDFGTGYSSISHLRDLPIYGLKLDRSFTAELTRSNARSLRLAAGLVAMAASLGLATIAEGVETEAQADILAGQGWQLGQGWLFGKAQPAQ